MLKKITKFMQKIDPLFRSASRQRRVFCDLSSISNGEGDEGSIAWKLYKKFPDCAQRFYWFYLASEEEKIPKNLEKETEALEACAFASLYLEKLDHSELDGSWARQKMLGLIHVGANPREAKDIVCCLLGGAFGSHL